MNVPDEQRLYDLVVIGSSAGGIEALTLLMGTLSPDFPVPIVIAQHLDPERPSHLGEILTRRTTLPVHTVTGTDPQSLSPGTVYVVPADRDVEIMDRTLHLLSTSTRRPKPSVDLLLSSAARAYGERVIAVILTGSGSDGATGARDVKVAGGTVVIENPETASYPSMPASLAPTTVDIVANLDRIGPLLCDLLTGLYVPSQPESLESLDALLDHVRTQSGIDFNQYKRPTIMRRLQRRMAATGAITIDDYMHYLQQHADESGRLVASFLINVTEFFRDPAFFEHVREHVLPDVIARAREEPGHELRIWSAGCATGEEPYSVAILLAELLGDEVDRLSVRIFATDVDTDAVTFARRGIYPAAALATVPDALRARYFVPVEDGYEITKLVRGLVVFGEHDLGQRAPFPHIDLVLCRNVLIYFTSELQKRALQLFAFALRDGGYLVLGNAETPSPLARYFVSVHPHFKIYRRLGERALVPPARVAGSTQRRSSSFELTPALTPPLPGRRLTTLPQLPQPPDHAHGQEERPRMRTVRETLGNQVLDLPIGVVVVDREYDVQTINSAAYRLLDVSRAATGKDLLHLAERVPTASLRAAIDAAFQSVPHSTGAETVVLVETTHTEPRRLRITCYPQFGDTPASDGERTVASVMLLISDVTGAADPGHSGRASEIPTTQSGRSPAKRRAKPPAEEIARLTQQLEEAHAVTRELRAANLELKEKNLDLLRGNDDLLVSQEEAQAASEEVKTLYEEMQATNEELETLNEEMEATVEELHATNDDLQSRSTELQRMVEEREEQRQVSERERARLEAILSSMADAILVVDAAGKTVLTNDAYQQLFSASEAEIVLDETDGETGGDPVPAGATLGERAVSGTTFTLDFTIPAGDRAPRWFEARGQPVHSGDTPQGGVVSIRDITDRSLRRLQERFLAMVSHELRTPITSILAYLQMLTRTDRPDGEARRLRLTSMALQQVRQLTLLVDDLSDLGRMQGGKVHLTVEEIDLATLVGQIVDSLNLMAIARASGEPPTIVFRVLPGSESTRIVGDPQRLEQIVTNLVVNALKYAPNSERIDIQLRQAHGLADLQVSDDGPGIPAADVPQLFSPFYQVARLGSKVQGGLGLGLFITRGLVEAHRGTITVRSIEGSGTTFTVRLPLLDRVGTAMITDHQGGSITSRDA